MTDVGRALCRVAQEFHAWSVFQRLLPKSLPQAIRQAIVEAQAAELRMAEKALAELLEDPWAAPLLRGFLVHDGLASEATLAPETSEPAPETSERKTLVGCYDEILAKQLNYREELRGPDRDYANAAREDFYDAEEAFSRALAEATPREFVEFQEHLKARRVR